MAQKISPHSFRVSISKNWSARWFFPSKGTNTPAGKYPFAKYLAEDEVIRGIIKKKIIQSGIASVDIERTSNHIRIFIRAARPGLIIGQGGKGIEDLSKAIERGVRALQGKTAGPKRAINLNVEELKRSETSSAYVAQQIAWDLERRLPFRRTMKKYLEQVAQNRDVKGLKLMLSGRLDGAEISRREALKKGALPLQTLRADIDYGTATAHTTYGTIGVKVWVYKGEVFKKKTVKES